MVQKVYEVEMMYIRNTSGNDYTIEVTGRRCKTMKLNFSNVEGIEIDAHKPLEVRNSYIEMSGDQASVWNLRFVYPTNFNIKYIGKIVIEVI